ncbi:MAG: CoA transferase, partial [Dietzia sp.]|nr:CoA transferase [Dietzia sp.]
MPVAIPAAVLAHAQTTADALGALAGIDLDAAELLGGRAALLGLQHRGAVSAGGATHLMSARDGWCALTLSRPDDIDAVPALVESDDAAEDPWPAVRRRLQDLGAEAFAQRARLLGLPVGVLGETPYSPAASPRVQR